MLVSRNVIPDGCEPVDRDRGVFPVTDRLNFLPRQTGIFEHSRRSRQSMTLHSWSALPSKEWSPGEVPQGRVLPHSSRKVYARWSTFDDGLAAIAQVGDHSEPFSLFKPPMSQLDQVQTQFDLFLVRQALGFHSGFGRPPQTCGVRQTEYSVAYVGKTDGQTDDDKAQAVTVSVRVLWGRTVMLPTSATYLFPVVFVQGVVKDNDDLRGPREQGLYHESEEMEGHPIGIPPRFCQESKDSGKVPGFIQSHRKDNLTYSVFAHGQHPTYQQRRKDPETRSAEAGSKMDLVNSERTWYMSLVHGVPPPHLFPKTGMAGTPLFFNSYLQVGNCRLIKMAKL